MIGYSYHTYLRNCMVYNGRLNHPFQIRTRFARQIEEIQKHLFNIEMATSLFVSDAFSSSVRCFIATCRRRQSRSLCKRTTYKQSLLGRT